MGTENVSSFGEAASASPTHHPSPAPGANAAADPAHDHQGQNIEALFDDLQASARELAAEGRSGEDPGLSEEALALFDILTRPAPSLSRAKEIEVKKVCHELRATLKREKLLLD